MVKDPVCKKSVDEKKTDAHMEHEGKTYYFCSWNCRSKFKEDADKFVSSK